MVGWCGFIANPVRISSFQIRVISLSAELEDSTRFSEDSDIFSETGQVRDSFDQIYISAKSMMCRIHSRAWRHYGEKHPRDFTHAVCLCAPGLICVRVSSRVAMKVRYRGEAYCSHSSRERLLCVAVPGRKGAGGLLGEGSGRVGEGWTSQQQRAVGVIIPPNAPCLHHVCGGRLSALMQKVTWVIKCSRQGWGKAGAARGRESRATCLRWPRRAVVSAGSAEALMFRSS